MKMSEALKIIKSNRGYRVHFEVKEGSLLMSDFFPERDEVPIESEQEAWRLAKEFAESSDNAFNVYVINAETFSPVIGYKKAILNESK